MHGGHSHSYVGSKRSKWSLENSHGNSLVAESYMCITSVDDRLQEPDSAPAGGGKPVQQ